MTTDERLRRLQRLLLLAATLSIVAFGGLVAVNLQQDAHQRTERAVALAALHTQGAARSREHAELERAFARVLTLLAEQGCVVPQRVPEEEDE